MRWYRAGASFVVPTSCGPGTAPEVVREAERKTASYLDPHSGDGWFVLHGVAVPGAVASIDHLVVTPAGVFVVESLEWSGPMSPDGR